MPVKPRTLSGFKDMLPSEAILKSRVESSISDVLLSFGFVPIETPHLEYADVLVKQGSDEIQSELYRFRDHGGRDVALRFDQTVPLARFITQHRGKISMPFKRYSIGNVFRGERAQSGRYREFTQCDFDFIGSDSLSCDAEILQVIYNCLRALSLGEFTIWVNHRGILNGIFEYFKLDSRIEQGIRIVDKIDKIGLDGVSCELQEKLGIGHSLAREIGALISIKQVSNLGDFFGEISFMKRYNDSLRGGLESLERMFDIMHSLSLDIGAFRVNFSVARGLGYYTGIVYETTLDDLRSIGSICSGGRYDNLTQSFSKERLSGVGASIGIHRLLSALNELKLVDSESTPARVLVIATSEDYLAFAHMIAEGLRRSEVRVEVYPDIVRVRKSLSYANSKGHEFSIIIGDDEFLQNSMTVRNMTSGMQLRCVSFLKVLEVVKG